MSDPGVNDQPDSNNESHDNPSMISPGARLAAYRQERGWTIEQVAGQLNLAPRQVVAIENDDYPSLPGMPIVRGFIRAYAKLLKVDAAPLLASLGGETVLVHKPIPPTKNLSAPFSEARLPSMTEKSRFSSKWIIALLLVILVAVIVWVVQHENSFSGLSQSAPSKVVENTATVPNPDTKPQVQPQLAAQEEKVISSTPETPSAVVTESPAATVGEAPGASLMPAPTPTAPVSPQAPPDEAAKISASEAAAKNTLQLNVREDSWIEIRRAGAPNAAVSRIVKAGETETFEVSEPVLLVVGNARGVEVSLRGAPVELKAVNGNVARLKLK